MSRCIIKQTPTYNNNNNNDNTVVFYPKRNK